MIKQSLLILTSAFVLLAQSSAIPYSSKTEVVKVPQTIIAGVTAHTTLKENKIGSLWKQLYSKYYRHIQKSEKYAIYSNYSKSDHSGSFDITIGAQAVPSEIKDSIPAGTYLKVTVSGLMPQAVIDEWPKLYQYIDEQKIKRTGVCDFEKHISNSEVEIYVHIQHSIK